MSCQLPAWLFERIEPEPNTGCWIWTGALNNYGYASFQVGGRRGRRVSVHRYSYEAVVGPIPAQLHLDHLCRVRACVNPAHLEPVTIAENLRRGDGPTGRKARQETCIHGHPLRGDNLYIRQNGTRSCRACHAARERARLKQCISGASGTIP